MKKMIALILVLGCALGLNGCSNDVGVKPYKDLETAEVSSCTVHLVPPNETIQIKEINELVKLLKNVVIYEEDNSYTEYRGQGVTFVLKMVDGTEVSIMAYNPFLVIDGVGYRNEYEPCEALNVYANRLLTAE